MALSRSVDIATVKYVVFIQINVICYRYFTRKEDEEEEEDKKENTPPVQGQKYGITSVINLVIDVSY